jgi:hypothetical protein
VCVHQIFDTVLKYLRDNPLAMRKGLLLLRDSEVSVHGQMAHCFEACGEAVHPGGNTS